MSDDKRMSIESIAEVTHFAAEFARYLESLDVPELAVVLSHFLNSYMTQRMGMSFLDLETFDKVVEEYEERSPSEQSKGDDK